jgi:hypothetical protein
VRGGRHPWVPPVGVAACSLVASSVHAVLGPGYVLDDWYTLRNAAFDGPMAAAGSAQQVARPGAAVAYALVFGVVGRQPLVTLALLSAIGAATAALLVVLLRRFFPESIAVGASLLWIVLPNHMSLEVWASAVNIGLSVLLAVSAGLVMLRPGRARWLCVPLLVAAMLCYEAISLVAAALVVAIPWATHGRIDRRLVAGAGAAMGATALWVVLHWHPDKHLTYAEADLSQALGAHLGWGVAPRGPVASLLLVAGLLGTALAVGRLVLPSLRPSTGPGEVAVVTGVVVVILGTAPFARYLYAPLGAGDRFNFVSSIGGALMWSGMALMVWGWRRQLAVALLAVLVCAGLVERLHRSILWHRAGSDAVAIQEAALRTVPSPQGAIVVGPTPMQEQNIAAFVGGQDLESALQLAYDDPDLVTTMTYSPEEFDRAPESQRVDLRPVSQLGSDTGPWDR